MRVLFLAAASVMALAATSVISANARDGVQCVRLREIEQSPVVDDRTIVVKLRDKGRYKRLDLSGGCSSIKYDGFVHATSSDELCNTDALITTDGGVCLIKSMTDITETEATGLLKKKR